jgi:hypothetical protein
MHRTTFPPAAFALSALWIGAACAADAPAPKPAGTAAESASGAEAALVARMTAAAKALAAALPADLLKANTFAYGGPEHRYWHWVPTPLAAEKDWQNKYPPYGRFGVPVEKLDVKAIGLLHDLLKVGLSGDGYRKVQLVIRQEGPGDPRQAFVGLDRSATSKPAGGPGFYHFTLFGEIGADKWGWRFEGHHVSLTFEVEGGRMRFSPSMIGFNPSPLPPRAAEMAMNLFRELSGEQQAAAHVVKAAGKAVPNDCSRDPQAPARPVGVKLDQISDDAKWYLGLLVEEYIGNYPEAVAKAIRKQMHAELAESHFAWWGPLDHAQPHFYRLQGKTFVIEMRHQGGGASAAHIHGVLRLLNDGSVNSTVAAK